MAGNAKQKLKLLYLLDILERETDEEHILSAPEICDFLAEYDIRAERKSIYSDIAILKEYGYDIVNTRSPKNGFFLASREFELAELRLLTDAIQAANFISLKKTNKLLEKIEKMMSRYQANHLNRQIYVNKRPKCNNEEIYYTIDLLNQAILGEKMVSFQYQRRVITDKNEARREEKSMTVSPYALIWSNDHYYLVCNNPKYSNLMHTRIDRMKKVTILEEQDARSFSEVSPYRGRFDSADYANKLFNMFSGEPQPVELLCKNSIVEEIFDRFGENVHVRSFNEDSFILCLNLAVSDGLVSWIMQYGDLITVRRPNDLKRRVLERAEAIKKLYK